MESVSKQEYMCILSKLNMVTTKFVALEQENQGLLGDLQQVGAEKVQQYEELSQQVHQHPFCLRHHTLSYGCPRSDIRDGGEAPPHT